MLAQVGNPLTTVRLVAQDNRVVDVFSDRGFCAGGLWIAPGDAAHITANPWGRRERPCECRLRGANPLEAELRVDSGRSAGGGPHGQ